MQKIIFGLFLALTGLSTAAAGDVSVNAKYCVFETAPKHDAENPASQADNDAFEYRLRNKCKAGDIVMLDLSYQVAALCDLSKPVIPGGVGVSYVCHLAPKREVY